MLCTPWASKQKLMLQICNAIIRSRLTYGQEAYFTASKSELQQLARVEVKFLRMILQLHKWTPHELVYQEAGWVTLDELREQQLTQFVVRSRITQNNLNEEIEINFDKVRSIHTKQKTPLIYRRTENIADRTKKTLEKCNIDLNNVENITSQHIPPWLEEKPKITTQYKNNYSKQLEPTLLITQAREELQNYNHYLQIYTDGSISSEGEVGCAFTIPAFNITKQYKLNKGVSIFSAELTAIMKACSYLTDLPRNLQNVVILSDSKSALQAIENETKNRNNMQNEIRHLCHNLIINGTNIELFWIPSHLGIRGNNIADLAAKNATSIPNISLDIGLSLTEVNNKIKRRTWKQKFKRTEFYGRNRNWLVFPRNLENCHPKKKLNF